MLVLPSRVAAGARTLLVAASALAVTACGGGGANSGSLPPNSNEAVCAQDTQVQIAIPAPNSGGNGSPSSIEIVANGNTNSLYQSYQSFQLLIAPPGVNPINAYASGNLTLTPRNGAPQPYASDYYYAASTSGLPYSAQYSVYLNNPSGNCQPQFLGTFYS